MNVYGKKTWNIKQALKRRTGMENWKESKERRRNEMERERKKRRNELKWNYNDKGPWLSETCTLYDNNNNHVDVDDDGSVVVVVQSNKLVLQLSDWSLYLRLVILNMWIWNTKQRICSSLVQHSYHRWLFKYSVWRRWQKRQRCPHSSSKWNMHIHCMFYLYLLWVCLLIEYMIKGNTATTQ